MYSQKDRDVIRGRIIKYAVITVIPAIALLAGFIAGLKVRSQALSQACAFALYAQQCFMWVMYLYPCIRYRRFLKDMETGLHREMRGSVVEVSDAEELQDGVRVHPVRILLTEEQDERIVYLNVSKADGFPSSGNVNLSCFGRHIRELLPA